MLEYRAGQAGRARPGFVAHVPHYLAQAGFPQATQAVIAPAREGRRPGASRWASSPSARRPSSHRSTPRSREDADFPAVVEALEEQYDRLSSSGAASVPSAEEIGAAVEQFLAEQDPPPDFRR